MKFVFVAALVLNTLSVSACPGLIVENGWIREPPPSAEAVAGFLTMRNLGLDEIRITKISSSAFAMSMLHETVTDGDHAHMTTHELVTIAPGAALHFAPGGLHVMLMQPRQPIASGLKVPMTITCEGGTLEFEAEVKRD